MMRETGLRHWLRSILTGLGAAVLAVFLVVGGFIAGLTLGHPLLAFGLPILGAALSLVLAQWFSSSLEESRDDPFAARLRTPWRLCDPELRNTGVWRAEFDLGSLDVADLEDPPRMRQAVERLIADWSYRIGHPYLGCRVVREVPAGAAKLRSFGASDGRSRIYQVTLDLGWGECGERTRRECGRLRIGAGRAEFQLEPQSRPQPHPLDREAPELKAADIDSSSPPTLDVAPARAEPMWDRWLDD